MQLIKYVIFDNIYYPNNSFPYNSLLVRLLAFIKEKLHLKTSIIDTKKEMKTKFYTLLAIFVHFIDLQAHVHHITL